MKFKTIFVIEFLNTQERNQAVDMLELYVPEEMRCQKRHASPYIIFDNGSTAQVSVDLLKRKLDAFDLTEEELINERFAGEHSETFQPQEV